MLMFGNFCNMVPRRAWPLFTILKFVYFQTLMVYAPPLHLFPSQHGWANVVQLQPGNKGRVQNHNEWINKLNQFHTGDRAIDRRMEEMHSCPLGRNSNNQKIRNEHANAYFYYYCIAGVIVSIKTELKPSERDKDET